MSDWNHAICGDCWNKKRPGEEPCRIIGVKTDTCCFCGNPTIDGIWVRNNPKDATLVCKGEHKED